MPSVSHFFDRVLDTSTTTGTGDFTVSGTSPTGYRTLSAVYTTGQRVPYVIRHQTADEWETGIGTYSAADTLTRTQVSQSSNSDALVNFSSGTKDVFVDAHAYYINDFETHGQVVARVMNLAGP